MQMYKGFNITTNKIPLNEQRGIAHHLMDYVDIKEDIIVSLWAKDARCMVFPLSKM